MAARVCEIAAGVLARLEGAWPENDTPTPTFAIDDDWDIDTIEDLAAITDRFVIVSDDNYAQVEQADRGEDLEEYMIVVTFVERYLDAGRPTKAWKEERKRLVQDNLFRVLNDHRASAYNGSPLGSGLAGVWPENCEVTVVMDREFIRKMKVFVSVIEVAYRQVREVP